MMYLHDPLIRALDRLDHLDQSERVDFMTMSASETQGYFKMPEPNNKWDTGWVEIEAHNIYADGDTIPNAICNWIDAAKRVVAAAGAAC